MPQDETTTCSDSVWQRFGHSCFRPFLLCILSFLFFCQNLSLCSPTLWLHIYSSETAIERFVLIWTKFFEKDELWSWSCDFYVFVDRTFLQQFLFSFFSILTFSETFANSRLRMREKTLIGGVWYLKIDNYDLHCELEGVLNKE